MNKLGTELQSLELADLYEKGEGVIWNTLDEASNLLSKTSLKVSRNQLKNAKDIRSFPEEITSLFKIPGVTTFTIRELVRARSALGIEKMLERAGALSPAKDAEERDLVLAALCDGQNKARKGRSRRVAELVAEYEAGKASKRWSNVRQASQQLGLSSQLYKAIKVLRLPKQVLELFSLESLTLNDGLEIEGLISLYGQDEIITQAKWHRTGESGLSNKDRLEILRSGSQASPWYGRVLKNDDEVIVKARRRKNKIVVEFHCLDEEGYLSKNLEVFRSVLQVALKTVRNR